MRRTKAKGFTLIELLVVIAIIALLVSILMPSLGRARELAKQAACMANLNAIGKARVLYEGLNEDRFPVLFDSGNPNSAAATTNLGKATVADPNDPLGAWEITTTGAMQNMWLMIEAGMVSVDAFQCPSDMQFTKTATGVGWANTSEFSYGMSFPYLQDESSNNNPAALSNTLSGGFVWMADRMESGNENPDGVTSNHKSAVGGCTIYLTFAGSVRKYAKIEDAACGIGGDEIYTNTGGTAGGRPADAEDTSINQAVRGS